MVKINIVTDDRGKGSSTPRMADLLDHEGVALYAKKNLETHHAEYGHSVATICTAVVFDIDPDEGKLVHEVLGDVFIRSEPVREKVTIGEWSLGRVIRPNRSYIFAEPSKAVVKLAEKVLDDVEVEEPDTSGEPSGAEPLGSF